MKKGTRVLKIVVATNSMELMHYPLVYYLVDNRVIYEDQDAFELCESIINWKLIHTSSSLGLTEISEGVYGD